MSILSSLALSVISHAFIYRPEVSPLQCFLIGSASVNVESSPSESSHSAPPQLSSSLLSPSFGATLFSSVNVESSPSESSHSAPPQLSPSFGATSFLSALHSPDSSSSTSRKPFSFTFDSASSVHLLTCEAACALLLNPVPSDLYAMGVSVKVILLTSWVIL